MEKDRVLLLDETIVPASMAQLRQVKWSEIKGKAYTQACLICITVEALICYSYMSNDLFQRLKHVDPSAYFPLIEEDEYEIVSPVLNFTKILYGN